MNNLLPIGSVIKLDKQSIATLMIIGYYPQDDQGRIYEYQTIQWPMGVRTSEDNWLINHADIEKIVFEGYVNDETKNLLAKLPLIMQAGDEFQREYRENSEQGGY